MPTPKHFGPEFINPTHLPNWPSTSSNSNKLVSHFLRWTPVCKLFPVYTHAYNVFDGKKLHSDFSITVFLNEKKKPKNDISLSV